MKPCFIVMSFCILLAACDAAKPPFSPLPAPAASFTLAGRIHDRDGAPVSGARIELVTDTSPMRTTESDAMGQYRFDKVGGRLRLRVTKGNYYEVAAPAVWVDRDTTIDISLTEVLLGTGLVLTASTPLRGRVTSPPCDPTRWDASALCEVVMFTPAATGDYELVLRWDGPSELDLLVDAGLYFGLTTNAKEIRALVPGVAGIPREVRIHSYYEPQDFELTATLK